MKFSMLFWPFPRIPLVSRSGQQKISFRSQSEKNLQRLEMAE